VVCQIAGVFPASCDQPGSPCIAKTYRHQEDPKNPVKVVSFPGYSLKGARISHS
jgi:hypothetical protein